jgi:hypothetical protein
MEPEGSLTHSQVRDSYLYPEPAQSSPYPHIPLPKDLANTLAAAVSEPALYRLLTIKLPNLISSYRCLDRIKVSVQLRLWVFCNKDAFSVWGVVSPWSKHQDGGPSLVGCPRQRIQYIRSYPPYCRPFMIRNLRTRHAVVTGTHLSNGKPNLT